jgi:hypothetical protein
MSVSEKLNESIKNSIESGTIDSVKQGPIIEAAQKIAAMIDNNPDWPLVGEKVDNVTPSVFLKYCEKLGIAPDVKAEKPRTDKNAKMHIVGNSKWKKQA